MSEKFCLKWNDFNTNTSRAFGLIRNEEFLQDVTLVGDDNSQVAAHKLVLSSCSEYFKNVFKSNKHSHPLLCLDGVTSADIMNILDYIYNGEVKLFQEDLDRFLAIAHRFKLEGLLGEENSGEQNSSDIINYSSPMMLSKLENDNEEENSAFTGKLSNITERESSQFALTDEERNNLVAMIEQYVEKMDDGGWMCKVCSKSVKGKNSRQQMQYHVEGNHLEGLSLPCHLCGKTFSSRSSLGSHKTRRHK